MEFCQRCGALIVMKDDEAVCASCGHKTGKVLKIKSSEKMDKMESVAVIKHDDDTQPIVSMKCPKCKHNKCYFWTQQTRAADESETKFFKCTKCKHSWRAYR